MKKLDNKKDVFKLVVIVVGFIIFSQNSLASANFISVNTEGLFLCNAGLMHSKSDSICYDPVNGSTCDPQTNLAGSCLCTSTNPVGDFASATWMQQNKNSHVDAPAGLLDYSMLIPPRDVFGGEIQDLGFFLGSEIYGARYFVQFCYRGPEAILQNMGPGATVDLSQGIYKIKFSMAALDKAYLLHLDPNARLFFQCDLRNAGLEISPRKSVELIPSLPLENDFSNQGNVQIGDSGLGASQELVLNLNSNMAQVPRFCTFSIYYSEATRGQRSQANQGEFLGRISVFK